MVVGYSWQIDWIFELINALSVPYDEDDNQRQLTPLETRVE